VWCDTGDMGGLMGLGFGIWDLGNVDVCFGCFGLFDLDGFCGRV
jgi:hypothetical protein